MNDPSVIFKALQAEVEKWQGIAYQDSLTQMKQQERIWELEAEVRRLNDQLSFSESSADEFQMQAAMQNALLAKQIPHWESVNDPPKFSGKVFVWRDMVGEFYDRELTFDVAYYNGLAGGRIPKGTFFQLIPGTMDYRVLDDVTHWWRPEPPQEVQDERDP